MSVRPVRLQLSRRKGFDLDALSHQTNGLDAVVITRMGRWGNPFLVPKVAVDYGLSGNAAQDKAVALYADWVHGRLPPELSPKTPPSHDSIRKALAGRNLACFCRPGTACHADVLLPIANPGQA